MHILLKCFAIYLKHHKSTILLLKIWFFFPLFVFFRAAPTAYGGSQARGRIRATADSLHHSHSNVGSEPCLQPTPQLTAKPDP